MTGMDHVKPLHILVIEDDADTQANMRDILSLDDHAVECARSAAETLARDDWSSISAIILDWKLPDATADELLPRLRRMAPDAAVIIVTGNADLQGAVLALRQGATDFILKPIEAEDLRSRLRHVAEYRQSREALRLAERRYRILVQNSSDVIMAFEPDGTTLYQSPSIEHMLGYRPEERVGRNIFKDPIVHPDDIAAKRNFFEAARNRPGEPVSAEFRLRHADGSWRYIEAVGQDLRDEPGVGAIVASYRDVTERKRAEEALREAQERALRSERLAAIGQMVTGLAHESRNALQRSQACLEMLCLLVQDRPKALDLIDRLQRAQDHLHHLYEDVRGYAAPVRLERRDCELSEIWRQAWSHLEAQRTGRVAALRERAVERDTRCTADPFRLEQVFRNIFENALAAAPDPVEIEVRCANDEAGGRPAFRLAVRDNGPGLGPEERKRVFEPFYTTRTKGTGLGMAIVRRIIEAHGGTIDVGGNEGPGAEFIITLPRGSS